jgi:hypothetical protein
VADHLDRTYGPNCDDIDLLVMRTHSQNMLNKSAFPHQPWLPLISQAPAGTLPLRDRHDLRRIIPQYRLSENGAIYHQVAGGWREVRSSPIYRMIGPEQFCHYLSITLRYADDDAEGSEVYDHYWNLHAALACTFGFEQAKKKVKAMPDGRIDAAGLHAGHRKRADGPFGGWQFPKANIEARPRETRRDVCWLTPSENNRGCFYPMDGVDFGETLEQSWARGRAHTSSSSAGSSAAGSSSAGSSSAGSSSAGSSSAGSSSAGSSAAGRWSGIKRKRDEDDDMGIAAAPSHRYERGPRLHNEDSDEDSE